MVMASPQNVYQPIKQYQTRIVHLHGSDDDADSPIICDLLKADILHPKFHLGLRLPNSEDDCNITYEALSYCWGSEDTSQSIICNGIQFPVTENLYQALSALRRPGQEKRYLWIDAICINQRDHGEKSQQVWNMFIIYQGASRVIAWLGLASGTTEFVLSAKDLDIEDLLPKHSLSDQSAPDDQDRFETLVSGLRDLYNRPWFSRLWVQQEICAAHHLVMQCGPHESTWSGILSSPGFLLNAPDFEDYRPQSPSDDSSDDMYRDLLDAPEQISDSLETIRKLEDEHKDRLQFFERNRNSASQSISFIAALLETGKFHAKDPRDHIYGILAMADYPAKPMLMHNWTRERQKEIFMPIDYEADLNSVLCATTWNLVMTMGLMVIAKFKCFRQPPGEVLDNGLASWAIDWPLVAQVYSKNHPARQERHSSEDSSDENEYVPRTRPMGEVLEQLQRINMPHACHTQLRVRGVVDESFDARAGGRIFERIDGEDLLRWSIDRETKSTDIIVYLEGLYPTGPEYEVERSNIGRWLLRPTANSEYILLAYLPLFDDVINLWCDREKMEDWFDYEALPPQSENRYWTLKTSDYMSYSFNFMQVAAEIRHKFFLYNELESQVFTIV